MFFATSLYCPACECWSTEDECWCCGGPMVADLSLRPRWSSVHSWSPNRTHTLWREGVSVACGELIDDLI